MKPSVLVTRRLPEPVLQKLKAKCQADINYEDTPLSKEEIIHRVADKDGMVTLLTDKIDRDIIDAGTKLKVISNVAVGYDNIDYHYARQKNIYVTNTPEVLTEATADLTWALILSVVRNIVPADRFTRQVKFKEWQLFLFLGSDLKGKRLGIIGLGRIGRAVAQRASGFEMEVVYYDIQRADRELEKRLKVTYLPLDQLLKTSDIITLHPPLTSQTHHLIDQKEFQLMKPGAYLINASRGPVVNEKALVEALKRKSIAGAGLDVYENEPRIEPELLAMDNVVLLPHIGSASLETRTKMAMIAIENVLQVVYGEKPTNYV
ncbi:D-glycerate dehydrogenase [bacterium (candidate division B38) B3_B38]|nr:MAG: D-glycerate dehydrogenase [bacterium (candidate division B38) B3_B38]